MSDKKLDPIIVHAVADGELPADEHAAAMEIINTDPHASFFYSEIRRLKSAVATLPEVEIPMGAWKSCTKRLDELDRNRKAERFVTRYAWAFSASVFFLILGAGTWNRLTGQHLGASDVTHMASILSPLDRAAKPDTANVGKWLQGRVGPVSFGNSVAVLSAEYGKAGDIHMARVVLADREGRMALLIWPGAESIDGFVPMDGTSLSSGHVLNLNCVAWVQGDWHYVLVGPRDVDALARVASSVSPGTVSAGSN